jgi:hypothetical protein
VPFRPYFTKSGGSGAKEFKGARRITFNRVSSNLGGEEVPEPDEYLNGELMIYSGHGRIYVKSGMNEETTVRIVNTGGALFRVFTIQPGEIVETRAAQGIYIVNQKKVTVK